MRTDDHSVRQLVDDLSSAALRDLLRNVRHHTELRRQIASGLIDERMVNDAYREYARREGADYRQRVADITVQYYSDLADLGNRYSEAFYADVLGDLGTNGDGHRQNGSDGDGGRHRTNGAGTAPPNATSSAGPDVEEVPIELHAPPGKEVMASFALENTESHAVELSIEVGSCQGPGGESFMAPLTVQPAQFVLEPGARRSITLRLVMLPTLFVPGHLYRMRLRIVGPSELVLLVTIWAEQPDAPTVPDGGSVAQKVVAESPGKTTPAKKTAAKKTPAKKTPAKKTPAKKTRSQEDSSQEDGCQEDGCQEAGSQEDGCQEDTRQEGAGEEEASCQERRRRPRQGCRPVMTDLSVGPAPTVVEGLHIGQRDHYRVATDVLARHPNRVALMQRSSSLLLGPEDGWAEEARFFDAAWDTIDHGTTWFHVASTTGIRRHLHRTGSSFAHRDDARRRLGSVAGTLMIGRAGEARPIKAFPVDHHDSDYKLDRQARMLVADFAGRFEAVVVVDVGDRQCSIHQCGPYADGIVRSVPGVLALMSAIAGLRRRRLRTGLTGTAAPRVAVPGGSRVRSPRIRILGR